MRPLSQDLLGCPRSCNGPGRSEKCTGQPCGICWKSTPDCPLLPLFLTSFFCSISTLLLFHAFCILLLSSSRNPSTAFIPGVRDLVFWQKAAETKQNTKKITLLAAFPAAAGVQWHCRGVLTRSADEGLHQAASHFVVRGPLSHSPVNSPVGLLLLPPFFGHSLHELSCILLQVPEYCFSRCSCDSCPCAQVAVPAVLFP